MSMPSSSVKEETRSQSQTMSQGFGSIGELLLQVMEMRKFHCDSDEEDENSNSNRMSDDSDSDSDGW